MIQTDMTERPSNPLLCVTVFDVRVRDARAMLRAGKSNREVQQKHGGCVLDAALKQVPLRDLVKARMRTQ